LLLWGLLFTCLGCAGPASIAEERFEVPAWKLSRVGEKSDVPLTLPAHLDAWLPNRAEHYVLHTDVDIPDRLAGRALTLSIPHMPALASLEVNGVEAVQVGNAPFDVYRASGPRRWRVPAEATRGKR